MKVHHFAPVNSGDGRNNQNSAHTGKPHMHSKLHSLKCSLVLSMHTLQLRLRDPSPTVRSHCIPSGHICFTQPRLDVH